MNKHIELVKKWLDDPDSVTREQLKANGDSAYAALSAANASGASIAEAEDNSSDYAAYFAAYFAYTASNTAWAATYAESAARYVKKYEALTEEKDK